MLSRVLVAVAAAFSASTALAGNSFMPHLPKEVMADLAKRDPSEYQTFQLRDEIFVDRDREDGNLFKRKVPKSLKGLQYTCKKANCMSITFDDGPYINMRSIVDAALAANIKVTFFINSYNYGCSYDEEYTSQ
jgi:peptidoglycan/xylan/chitin deacetylase (PgdA/CDA1 family)